MSPSSSYIIFSLSMIPLCRLKDWTTTKDNGPRKRANDRVEKYRPVHLDDVVSHQDITATSKLRSHSDGRNELMSSREIHRSGQITPFTTIRSTRYVYLFLALYIVFSSSFLSRSGKKEASQSDGEKGREE